MQPRKMKGKEEGKFKKGNEEREMENGKRKGKEGKKEMVYKRER